MFLNSFSFAFLFQNENLRKSGKFLSDCKSKSYCLEDNNEITWYDPQMYIKICKPFFWSSVGLPRMVLFNVSNREFFDIIWNHKTNILLSGCLKEQKPKRQDILMNSFISNKYL